MNRPLFRLMLAGTLIVASACTKNAETSDAITVRSTGDACELSASEAPSGDLVFEVTNEGTEVTEFYFLADDGLAVVGEVENIGPGITRNLTVRPAAGTYVAACKPGMVGDGIRSNFTVTDSGR